MMDINDQKLKMVVQMENIDALPKIKNGPQ